MGDSKIPPKEPEKAGKGQYRCNTRILINEQERYCEELVDRSARCDNHNVGLKGRVAREEARLAKIADPALVAERVAELRKDKRNLTTLDELILYSLATLQELENRFPAATVSPSDAITISRLREKHAELVHKRVDLEVKLKTLLDASYIFEQSALLFEEKIVDKNTQSMLLEGIGVILDNLVQSGNAVTDEGESPE